MHRTVEVVIWLRQSRLRGNEENCFEQFPGKYRHRPVCFQSHAIASIFTWLVLCYTSSSWEWNSTEHRRFLAHRLHARLLSSGCASSKYDFAFRIIEKWPDHCIWSSHWRRKFPETCRISPKLRDCLIQFIGEDFHLRQNDCNDTTIYDVCPNTCKYSHSATIHTTTRALIYIQYT